MLHRLRRAKILLALRYNFDFFPFAPLACVPFDCQPFWNPVAPFICHSCCNITRYGPFPIQFCSACMGPPIIDRDVVDDDDGDGDGFDDYDYDNDQEDDDDNNNTCNDNNSSDDSIFGDDSSDNTNNKIPVTLPVREVVALYHDCTLVSAVDTVNCLKRKLDPVGDVVVIKDDDPIHSNECVLVIKDDESYYR